MLDRLSETITNADIPLERVEGKVGEPLLVFQATATQQQQDDAAAIVAAFDWSESAHLTWLLGKARVVAADKINEPSFEVAVLRAIVLLTLDEINALRQWLTAFKAQVALATNLANLQTRVAALPDLPDRTAQQVKMAISNKISAGEAD